MLIKCNYLAITLTLTNNVLYFKYYKITVYLLLNALLTIKPKFKFVSLIMS